MKAKNVNELRVNLLYTTLTYRFKLLEDEYY